MASAIATEKLFAHAKIEMFHHAPADAAIEQSVKAGATALTWKDLRDYNAFAVIAMTDLLVGTGMTELSIYAAEDATGTNATEIKTTGAIAADAVGDYAVLECIAEEIAQIGKALGYNLRYVAAYVDCNHNDDEVAVTYIRHEAKNQFTGLTATTIS
jgi:hypothetical protein